MRASVIGSGPNGLAAAVILARAGYEVTVFEREDQPGGGLRTTHFESGTGLLDICSAVHPMAVSSKFFHDFRLTDRVQFSVPSISYAHALDGRAAVAYKNLTRTVEELGRDGPAWGRAMGGLVKRVADVRSLAGLAIEPSLSLPAGALSLGVTAALLFPLLPGKARALASGVTAHGAGPMSSLSARIVGAVLAVEAHTTGWPIPLGGSQVIARALVDDLRRHGGEVVTGQHIADLRSVWSPGEIAVLDTSPDSFATMAHGMLPPRYRRALSRYRYGNGASKVDFVLREPIPWSDSRLFDAGTVHLGGPASVVSAAESSARKGVTPLAPFTLVSQPTRFDRTRLAKDSNQEIVWSYAHVPNGAKVDATELIVRRIEAFAPGFRDVIEHSESRTASWYESHNANFKGGDVLGGRVELRQFLTRPVLSPAPWRTPIRGVYLCSAATPPGAGVHGMGGWHAARLAIYDASGESLPNLAP